MTRRTQRITCKVFGNVESIRYIVDRFCVPFIHSGREDGSLILQKKKRLQLTHGIWMTLFDAVKALKACAVHSLSLNAK